MSRSMFARTGGPVLGIVAALAVPAAATARTVSHWGMNEKSGSRMHDSVGHNFGRVRHVKMGVRGWHGRAYRFNGRSSIIRVRSRSSLNPGPDRFTISAHVRFRSRPTRRVGDYDLIRKGLSSTDGGYYKMEILRSGQAFCKAGGSRGDGELVAGPNLADNRWHRVACVKESRSLAVVVDGKEYERDVHIGAIENDAPLTIGAKSGGGDWYRGLMDDARFAMP